jgi:hypothetical protein
MKTEKTFFKNISGTYWFLYPVESLHPKINTGKMQYFNYDWFNKFTAQVPNLVTVDLLLFLTSHFTTNAQSIIHLNQCTHGHNLSWSPSCSLRSRGVANGLKKMRSRCFCPFSIVAEYTRVFRYPCTQRKRRIDFGQTWGLYFENDLSMYSDINSSSFFVPWTLFWSLSKDLAHLVHQECNYTNFW